MRESRYGALAIYPNLDGLWDSHKMFASVHGIHSKESARKMALKECKRKSGHSCQVFDYADQCLSVTTGLDSEGLKIYSAVSPQPGQASLDAMQQCIAAQAKECEFVVQEECSLPETPAQRNANRLPSRGERQTIRRATNRNTFYTYT